MLGSALCASSHPMISVAPNQAAAWMQHELVLVIGLLKSRYPAIAHAETTAEAMTDSSNRRMPTGREQNRKRAKGRGKGGKKRRRRERRDQHRSVSEGGCRQSTVVPLSRSGSALRISGITSWRSGGLFLLNSFLICGKQEVKGGRRKEKE